MSSLDTAQEFFAALARGDVEGALSLAAPDATVKLVPLGMVGALDTEGRRYFAALLAAFPDLSVRVRRLFAGSDGTAVAEITLEGTQAADFWGIIDQEKHMDLDQVWFLRIQADAIHAVTAYWCQNQLCRRLAVKRLDRVTITA